MTGLGPMASWQVLMLGMLAGTFAAVQELAQATFFDEESSDLDESGEEGCDLSLRQLRGRMMLSTGRQDSTEGLLEDESSLEEHVGDNADILQEGSCQEYGCNSAYRKERSCQCNEKCTRYGNCCPDFVKKCGAVRNSTPGHPIVSKQGSCKEYGCEAAYSKEHSCQCNTKCKTYGNCCVDYASTCGIPTASGPSTHGLPSGLPLGHPSPSKSYPRYPGFTLWLVEEFDVPINLDSDPIWTWSDGGLHEGQVRFVKEQISFGGGKMRIEVKKNHGGQQPCSHAQSQKVKPKPLVSGELRTRYNMFRYGRYEVRMKAPSVQPGNAKINGNFVSTMFVFRDASFKHWREIDLEVTGRRAGAISTNVINGDYKWHWYPSMEETDYPTTYHHINARASFHTYAFEWLPSVIRWYVDGKVVREKHNGGVPIPDKSAKIMMNLWIYRKVRYPFGGFDLKNDRFPMHNEYDWFRFYKWDGDKHYPPLDMSPGSITEDDKYLTGNNPCDGIPQNGLVIKKGKKFPACHATCR